MYIMDKQTGHTAQNKKRKKEKREYNKKTNQTINDSITYAIYQ